MQETNEEKIENLEKQVVEERKLARIRNVEPRSKPERERKGRVEIRSRCTNVFIVISSRLGLSLVSLAAKALCGISI